MSSTNKKAVALIIGVSVVMMLTVLSTAILTRSVSEGSHARRYVDSTQAFWLAEAGAQRAVSELGGSWSGWTDDGVDNKIISDVTLGPGTYSVFVSDVSSTTINPVITATGHVPDSSTTNRIERDILVDIAVTIKSPFNYAGYGKSVVALSGGGQTDSYDSSLGAYGGGNVGSGGDLGTDSSAAGAITLEGTSIVNGNANTGSGGTVTVGADATLNGTPSDSCAENYNSVTIPSDLDALTSGGNYSLTSPSSLSAGDYKFSSISLSSDGVLTLNGTVRIYVSGNINITGNAQIVVSDNVHIYTDGKVSAAGNGIANNTNIPANLLIYSTYSGGGDGVKFSGSSDFYGAVLAPDARIKISGGGDAYGSLIGDNFTVTGGGNIHYDEALTSVTEGGSTSYSVGSWQDQNNPYPITP